jgi:phosphoserine aminotransferase
MYNALLVEGVEALVKFMNEFRAKNEKPNEHKM